MHVVLMPKINISKCFSLTVHIVVTACVHMQVHACMCMCMDVCMLGAPAGPGLVTSLSCQC